MQSAQYYRDKVVRSIRFRCTISRVSLINFTSETTNRAILQAFDIIMRRAQIYLPQYHPVSVLRCSPANVHYEYMSLSIHVSTGSYFAHTKLVRFGKTLITNSSGAVRLQRNETQSALEIQLRRKPPIPSTA